MEILKNIFKSTTLKTNDLVIINYNKLTKSLQYQCKPQEYKKFIEYAKGKICVVSYENSFFKHNKLVCLYTASFNQPMRYLVHEKYLVKLNKEDLKKYLKKEK